MNNVFKDEKIILLKSFKCTDLDKTYRPNKCIGDKIT